ncbi:hypothetical protein AUK22_00195 [bacterium CG2_30_54_10]|nr:MAG: hypothetical protein AUK22_00195 [bacterium CG2_30_54_10]
MTRNKIQDLVFSFMNLFKIPCRSTQEGIWQITIPDSEKAFFNGFQELSFTFDREVAEKHRDLEMIAEGSYLLKKIVERLIGIPKVSRMYKLAKPELPPIEPTEPGKTTELMVISPGKVHYRQQVIFNFKVGFLSDARKERLFSVLADPANHKIYLKKGLGNLDPARYQETPEPGVPTEESGEDILRLYLQSCRQLEAAIGPEVEEIRSRNSGLFEAEFARHQGFLEEQKKELLKKKENVCFHLYFFQKEEEIDRAIKDLETDHERKVAELKEKYGLKVEIGLINAIVLGVPTVGVPASQIKKKRREMAMSQVTVVSSAKLEALPVA